MAARPLRRLVLQRETSGAAASPFHRSFSPPCQRPHVLYTGGIPLDLRGGTGYNSPHKSPLQQSTKARYLKNTRSTFSPDSAEVSEDSRRLPLDLAPQPTDTACGPTCLHGIYRYYGLHVPVSQLIAEIPSLHTGGTLAVYLAIDALKRGFNVVLHTFNLNVFDPTWLNLSQKAMVAEMARAVKTRKDKPKTREALKAYRQFIELGGKIKMKDLSSRVLRRYLDRDMPVLTGLCATYLYQSSRENPETGADDPLNGAPAGHFVVVTGYDKLRKRAWVADPYPGNPYASHGAYDIPLERLITAILLGVFTYDGNLLIVTPREPAVSRNTL